MIPGLSAFHNTSGGVDLGNVHAKNNGRGRRIDPTTAGKLAYNQARRAKRRANKLRSS